MSSVKEKLFIGLGGAAAGSLLSTSIAVNEGYSENAYKDSAGVWTVCYGDTANVNAGTKATPQECMERLKRSIDKHSVAVTDLPEDISLVALLGAMDMTYNVGVAGFRNSAAKRYLMNGLDYRKAGQAVLRWKYITVVIDGKEVKYDCSKAGNKLCEGLWRRRLWQSKAIGNEFSSPEEALGALQGIYYSK